MKKYIYIYEKALALVLAFAMIVGFWSGMTLDARAATDISSFEIKIKEPVAGDSFPGTGDVEVINPAGAIDVIGIEWRKEDNDTLVTGGTADYNTIYRANFPMSSMYLIIKK